MNDYSIGVVRVEAGNDAECRGAAAFSSWLAEHKADLVEGLDRLPDAAHHGTIPVGAIIREWRWTPPPCLTDAFTHLRTLGRTVHGRTVPGPDS